jgi:hypothetical protein
VAVYPFFDDEMAREVFTQAADQAVCMSPSAALALLTLTVLAGPKNSHSLCLQVPKEDTSDGWQMAEFLGLSLNRLLILGLSYMGSLFCVW